jgi:hypothetical protein
MAYQAPGSPPCHRMTLSNSSPVGSASPRSRASTRKAALRAAVRRPRNGERRSACPAQGVIDSSDIERKSTVSKAPKPSTSRPCRVR